MDLRFTTKLADNPLGADLPQVCQILDTSVMPPKEFCSVRNAAVGQSIADMLNQDAASITPEEAISYGESLDNPQ